MTDTVRTCTSLPTAGLKPVEVFVTSKMSKPETQELQQFSKENTVNDGLPRIQSWVFSFLGTTLLWSQTPKEEKSMVFALLPPYFSVLSLYMSVYLAHTGRALGCLKIYSHV